MWDKQRPLHSNPFAACAFMLIFFRTEINGAVSCPFPSWLKTRQWRQCLQSNGHRLDIISCLETLFTFLREFVYLNELVLKVKTGPSWRKKTIEIILFDVWKIDYLMQLWRLKFFLCPFQIVGYCWWLGKVLMTSRWVGPWKIWQVMQQWQKIRCILLLYHGVELTECIECIPANRFWRLSEASSGYWWALRCEISAAS